MKRVAIVITLGDVAKHAKVSVSTVANVVAERTSRMDPQILIRVSAAIAELGYQPNHMARSLKTGSTPLIGLLLPSISNPIYGTLAREIEAVANDHFGLRVLIGNSYRNKEKERDFIRDLMGHGIRGVIVVSPSLEQTYFSENIARGLVVVSFDRRSTPETEIDVDYVSVDNFNAVRILTNYLIENGHRQLAYVTPSLKTISRLDKISGFLAAAKNSGLSASAEVIDGQLSTSYEDAEMVQLGSELAKKVFLRSSRPTGVVAMNDLLAIGLISGFRGLGIRVPEDISVVGMDDFLLSEVIHPGLTTVRAPLKTMAKTMVERIVLRMGKKKIKTSEFSFMPELVVRKSVQKISVPKLFATKFRTKS